MKHCQICSEGDNTLHGHFPFMHVEFDNAFRFVEDEVWADMKATAVGNERDKQQLTKLIPTEFFLIRFQFYDAVFHAGALRHCSPHRRAGILSVCGRPVGPQRPVHVQRRGPLAPVEHCGQHTAGAYL